MMASRKLRKLQFGLETTAGDAVAASNIWRGTGTLEDTREIRRPDEDVGYLSRVDRSYTANLGGRLSLDSVEATFEQLPVLLSCAIAEDTAGTADGEGSGYIYTFAAPTTSAATLSTLTWEGGDSEAVEEMEYAYPERLRIEGSPGDALMMSADFVGRQVSTSSFTGALTLDTVEEIVFSKGTLYIDDVGDTIGDTTVSSTLLGVDIDFGTGIVAKRAANGELYFDFVTQTGPDITVQLTYEHNASAVAEKANWRSETPRQIRLVWEGSELTTDDTYTHKTFQVDMAGKYEAVEAIDELDGNDIVRCTFKPAYNSDAELFFEAVVVNEMDNLFT
jgi:hypothetical protein